MFGFIKNWLARRRFQRSREIYTFFDGERQRSIDPWRCYRKFISHELFDDATSVEAEEGQEPQCSNAIKAISESFELPVFDPETGKGMTDAEIYAFLQGILEYTEEIKKKRSPGQTLPKSTDQEFASLEEWAATKPPSPSGSCSPAHETDEAELCSEPSTLH